MEKAGGTIVPRPHELWQITCKLFKAAAVFCRHPTGPQILFVKSLPGNPLRFNRRPAISGITLVLAARRFSDVATASRPLPSQDQS
jgi:hypothetical protein